MRVMRATLVSIGALLSISCTKDSTAPEQVASAPTTRRVVGLVEITFRNIGSPNMTSSALVASSVAELEAMHAARAHADSAAMRASFDLTVPSNTSGPPGSATIELAQIIDGSFTQALTVGGLPANRYLEATYRVRNARADSSAFDTPRRNLTFVAVSTANTIGDTPVRVFLKANGRPADLELTRELLPTSLVAGNLGGVLTALAPDILQVMAESELSSIALPPAVTNIFPYGFVVKKEGSTTTRTLNASPAPTQFDGVVSFAFRIPKQSSAVSDPTTISVMMLALDDSETRLTQSLEEQYPAAATAARTRAISLGATTVTLLPGGTVAGVPGIRTICAVRTAGTASSPTAFMVNVPSSLVSLLPNPFGGAANFIPRTTNFKATFSSPVSGANSKTFSVRGQQSGPAFGNDAYSGNGTATITTPTKTFFAGEVVEVAIVTSLSCPTPIVTRFRTATGVGQGNFFPGTASPAHDSTYALAVGDLNRNGKLDIVATNLSANNISVFFGNGDGTLQAQQTYTTGRHPIAVALGDIDGDGNLDVVVANELDRTVSLRLGRVNGTFGEQTTFAIGSARAIALGDIDGDGLVDAVVANAEGTVSLLTNNGAGAFYPQRLLTASALGKQTGLAIGDLNRDGALDLVVTDSTNNRVSIWLGNGNGTFQAERNATVGSGPSSVAIGDFNGDGIPDLAVSNQTANTVSVLLGIGSGSFQAPSTLAVGARPASCIVGDFNGDGKLDITTASLPDREASELLGNGDGTFQSRRTFFIGEGPRTIVAGDFDNNTILGVAVANLVKNGTVTVLVGRTAAVQ